MEADPAAIGPEAIPVGASVESDEWHLKIPQVIVGKNFTTQSRRMIRKHC
jgi:hypothetical protein